MIHFGFQDTKEDNTAVAIQKQPNKPTHSPDNNILGLHIHSLKQLFNQEEAPPSSICLYTYMLYSIYTHTTLHLKNIHYYATIRIYVLFYHYGDLLFWFALTSIFVSKESCPPTHTHRDPFQAIFRKQTCGIK